jgi:hypothetical protein
VYQPPYAREEPSPDNAALIASVYRWNAAAMSSAVQSLSASGARRRDPSSADGSAQAAYDKAAPIARWRNLARTGVRAFVNGAHRQDGSASGTYVLTSKGVMALADAEALHVEGDLSRTLATCVAPRATYFCPTTCRKTRSDSCVTNARRRAFSSSKDTTSESRSESG